ncbi:hypothetical protein [Nonomuraea endophytica]|uniref:Uncharacterized protein n=1 Tax=Nonomuraea endophytica TaxID=714136 RepID=A0A7W8A6F1_9ACTN|nr:hypothetical protein [Nonomuraea endophytica]MBB5079083.1 hypothetical protein [Nonomuraea endophytica]
MTTVLSPDPQVTLQKAAEFAVGPVMVGEHPPSLENFDPMIVATNETVSSSTPVTSSELSPNRFGSGTLAEFFTRTSQVPSAHARVLVPSLGADGDGVGVAVGVAVGEVAGVDGAAASGAEVAGEHAATRAITAADSDTRATREPGMPAFNTKH